MAELLTSLVPLALGAAVSPIAVVAVVVVLLSHQPRQNGVAFLAGWAVGILVTVLGGALAASALAGRAPDEPPTWVSLLRLVIGLVLLASAFTTWRRQHAPVRQMATASTPSEVVAAAPQLPGWLSSVASFQPGQCLVLGIALFALNPVDLACGVGAGVALVLADVSATGALLGGLCFVALALLPVLLPVGIYLVRGARARPVLERLRRWLAGHNGLLTAALFALIGTTQVLNGLQGL